MGRELTRSDEPVSTCSDRFCWDDPTWRGIKYPLYFTISAHDHSGYNDLRTYTSKGPVPIISIGRTRPSVPPSPSSLTKSPCCKDRLRFLAGLSVFCRLRLVRKRPRLLGPASIGMVCYVRGRSVPGQGREQEGKHTQPLWLHFVMSSL